MQCDKNSKLSQVGTLTGNPIIDFYRVKAPVVSAGPTDSGKDQSHSQTNKVSDIEVDHLASIKHYATSAPTTTNVNVSNWVCTPPRETSGVFRKSTLVVRSPERSASEGDIYVTPRTDLFMENEAKRKRLGSDSAERNSKKSQYESNDTVSKLERMVARLCLSVSGSSNTKKEIRDISSQLRSLVARLVSERCSSETKKKTMDTEIASKKVKIDVTLQSQSCSSDNEKTENVCECTSAKPEMKDASIQTEPTKKPMKGSESPMARIDKILDSAQGNQLIDVLSERWPGEAYKHTKTVKGDLVESLNEDGAAIIVRPTPDNDENIREVGQQSYDELNEPFRTLMKGIKLKPGDIARISTTADILVKTSSQVDSQRYIYMVALDPALTYSNMIAELLKSFATLKEYVSGDSIPKLMYGTLIENASGSLRKVLEYMGRKQNSQFQLHGIWRVNKRMKQKANKGEEQDRKTRRQREDTIIVTPKEGVSYADLLKSMKKGCEPQKLGIQIRSVRTTDTGSIRICTSGGDRRKLEEFQKEISEKVGNSSTAEILIKEQTIIIRDLDDSIDEEDVTKAIKKEVGDDAKFKVVIAETKNKAGYKYAFVNIPCNLAPKVLCNRRINVGWSRCRIEQQVKPPRCFKCQGFGHLAYKCDKTPVKLCLRCGSNGHVVATCKEPPCCLECNEQGHRSDSMKCPKYRKLVEDLRVKERQLYNQDGLKN